MIDKIDGSLPLRLEPSKQRPLTSDKSFVDALDAAKKLVQTTQEAEQYTNELTYDFMTGKNDNIHNLMIAQEKSGILLQFTMQVRNQLLEAYKEIMRTPI